MSVFVNFLNVRGEVRFSSLPSDACQSCVQKCSSGAQLVQCDFSRLPRRQGKNNQEAGAVYICDDSKDSLNSAKKFKEKLRIYSEVSNGIGEIRNSIREESNKKAARLIHNLASLNGHNIQEAYLVVPQEALNKDVKQVLRTIKTYIQTNVDGAAEAILKIMKNNISMKTEFSVFNKLYDIAPRLSKTSHPVHKIIMNVMHLFYQDFFSKNIDTYIEPTTERIYVDYESTHVAIYHLIENASKYICPNTKLSISFRRKGKYLNVFMDMISVRIEDAEMDKIFQDGYSGENALYQEKAGNGMGMDIILKVLELNGACLFLVPNSKMERNIIVDGAIYNHNLFVIKLPSFIK